MTLRSTSRRNFLLSSLAAGGGIVALDALGPFAKLVHAAEPGAQTGLADDRYYIFCYFSGAWDVLLSLDPRDPTLFTAENAMDTRIVPGYEMLQPAPESPLIDTPFGPVGFALGDLATQHADKIAIVRGMSMDTLSHSTGRRRFLTGKPPSGLQARGSSAATWLASMMGKEQVIPNLAIRVESFNADQPAYATGLKVSTVNDMLRALTAKDPKLNAFVEHQLDFVLRQASLCNSAEKSDFQTIAEASRVKALELVSGGLSGQFNFLANTQEMAELRQHYNDIPKNTNGLGTNKARAALATQAIMKGVSRAVSVQVAGGCDTHYSNWQTNQATNQMGGFSLVARMIEDLAAKEYKGTGTSWLDHTNILCFSEFSRTPMINAQGGRDHWLGNSCLLAGADIKGGQALGASSNVGMQPQAVNLATGQVDLNAGDVVKPEHVLRALFHAGGVEGDPADLRAKPLTALLKNG